LNLKILFYHYYFHFCSDISFYFHFAYNSLPPLLAQAARSAAEADGVASPSNVHGTNENEEEEEDEDDDNNNHDGNIEDDCDEEDDDDTDTKPDTDGTNNMVSNLSSKHRDSALAAMERARAAVNAAAANGASNLSNPLSSRKSQDTNAPVISGGGKKKGAPLRRGKWTAEEEAYASRLIQEFKGGLLPLTDGTTLRTFLSKLLNCDPMRISKKFVGSNCIGKQVFRRRTAEINRLTPEQIQQNRAELGELERRFLDRVAQTNRVKSSGVGGNGSSSGNGNGSSNGVSNNLNLNGSLNTNTGEQSNDDENNFNPPWLNPPIGYKHGQGAAMAAANLTSGAPNRSAAAAGRALLQSLGGSNDFKDAFGQFGQNDANGSFNSRSGSAGLMALAGLGGGSGNSRQDLLNALSSRGSASSLFAAAAASNSATGLSSSAMAQIARNASAARLAGLAAAGSSMNNLLLKSGLSREQLSQLARDGGVSSASLSNMMDRQSSFDALMSLDLQSLQSIDNLANLIQSGGTLPGQNPHNGLKNWSAAEGMSHLTGGLTGSGGNLSDLASARRLASVGRMQSLLRSLSNQNIQKNGPLGDGSGGSNANFSSLLQSVQSNFNSGNSAGNLFGNNLFGNNMNNNNFNTASALSLANLLRDNSSTGLSALRQQDGFNQRNSSVDDFLSLVAAGDIPHQDPSLLNISLLQQQQQQQQQNGNNSSGAQAAATLLAQQQLLAQLGGSNSILAAALAQSGSFGNLSNNNFNNNSSNGLYQQNLSAASLLSGSSAASLFNASSARNGLSNLSGMSSNNNDSNNNNGGPSLALKRKLMEMEGQFEQQGNSKRQS
jgi:hypothetical protein